MVARMSIAATTTTSANNPGTTTTTTAVSSSSTQTLWQAGATLYELGVAEAEMARAEKRAEVVTDHFFKLQLQQALCHLQEAVLILSQEPPRSRDLRWYTHALDAATRVAQDLGVDLATDPALRVVLSNDDHLLHESAQNA
ncbi:hypothetical protein OTU49_010171 [Cherax quadricarinatus]|uniref:Uncharacterized protein n=1 Tax=Cherax quadricarinatus TaxID=27406 RepID=A0AAW0WEY3_CHEQU